MWVILAFLSASLLGFYDVFKKIGVTKNAVIPVLFLNTLFCTCIFLPFIILSRTAPEMMQQTLFFVPGEAPHVHLYIILKSIIVLTSWLFAYYAMKHLPITLSSPIKASQPVLTLLGALLIYGERLNPLQWAGVSIALFSFYLLSLSGK
ncbi:MAG: EamA family transporter, partial [Bacteroidales bacterium]